MNGSIEKRKNQSWKLTVELGRDENGKRLRKYETVRGPKKEAERRLRELLTNLDKGIPINMSKANVGEFLGQWLRDYAETNTSPRTVEGYKGVVNRYLVPSIGRVPLTKLTPQHVQGLYRDMLDRGLSPQTILHAHRIFSEALGHAVKWGLLGRNVCEAVDPPRPKRKEMNTLDPSEVRRLLDVSSSSTYGAVIFLALYTGMRRGEILGLRWSDVDLKNRTISVTQTLTYLKGKGLVFGEPKTAYSRRLVTLPSDAAALLAGLRVKQKEQLQESGGQWEESCLVFGNTNGKPVHPDSVTKSFGKIIKRSGLPHVRFHDLRHTHATLMLKQGVHPKIVSERLGHASVNITLDTYSHVLPNMQEEAALAFEEVLADIVV
ncbi:MAG: site-specific integrase [Planctomycetes bacterium]|nr:site-specific integrase [Planctomycetota bacterium]